MVDGRRRVCIVQQGAWDMPKEAMPLAAGYLKAAVDTDERLRDELDVRIANFRGGAPVEAMAHDLFVGGAPDVLAMSVFGWNFWTYGHIATTYKQLKPDGWVVWGGGHVANQAERVFSLFPAVDAVVNEEGERVFPELLRAYLSGCAVDGLGAVAGVSFRDGAGEVVTTDRAGKIRDLDSIPSPFLTGAMPMTLPDGTFRYDIGLMETNRGCPYRCTFCDWGSAIGEKPRDFSRERLRAELDYLGYHKVDTILLCDANFGMRDVDAEFVEDVIRTRERRGFPRAIETSWAKNKSQVFFDIVQRMKDEGLHGSMVLALQTLSDDALTLMRRKNMKVNAWHELVEWLNRAGMDYYAELIWGAPGETVDSFLAGYDDLSKFMSRIAVYPLVLLPNTGYVAEREKHSFVTVRGARDDYEYVLAHRTMTMDDNAAMQRFMFWARTVAENAFFRWIWTPLRDLAGLTQSAVLTSMADWFDRCDDAVARQLLGKRWLVTNSQVVVTAMRHFYSEPQFESLFRSWWVDDILPRVPVEHRAFLDEVYRYDWLTRPLYYDDTPPALPVEVLDGHEYWVRADVAFDYPVRRLVQEMRTGVPTVLEPEPTLVSLYYRPEFRNYVDNMEVAIQFCGAELASVSRVGELAVAGAAE